MHAGHVWCIQECARQCDYLIVLTNTDDYIALKKGSVPIELEDRLYILSNIKGVNEVDVFPEGTENAWINRFHRDRLEQEWGAMAELVVFHSDELKGDVWVPGQKCADEIVFIDKVNRQESVSKIYDKIQRRDPTDN